MEATFLKVIILAAVSDGEIQEEEMEMLNQIKKIHPMIKNISEEITSEAMADVYNKLSAGMDTKHILEQLGDKFSDEQKSSAYALAREVCAADFKVLPAEKDFIELIETEWNISTEVIDAVKLSIELRYFT